MQNTTKFWLSTLAMLCLTPAMAWADHRIIQGRTGLPTVREGGNDIWMELGEWRGLTATSTSSCRPATLRRRSVRGFTLIPGPSPSKGEGSQTTRLVSSSPVSARAQRCR